MAVKRRTHRALLAGTCVAAMLLPVAAWAQDPAPADDNDGALRERITVTAQKREQDLQDVPIAVTTVSGQLFKDIGAKDIKDLVVVTPGMTVTSTSSEASTTARIRGIGTVGDNPGLESSVGVVIDGVYRSRNSVGFGDLGEVERIEILKGPQGTLFGKNTSAGVINVLTEEPGDEFGANAELTVGNYEAIGGSAGVNFDLTGDDVVTARLFGVRRTRQGFYDVVTGAGPRTQTDDADLDYYSIRGQIAYNPNDMFSLRVIGDFSERDEQCCLAVGYDHRNVDSGLSLTGDFVASSINLVSPNSIDNSPLDPFSRVAYGNYFSDQQIDDKGISAQFDWDIGGPIITSITAYRDWGVSRASDPDYTAADILRIPNNGNNDTTQSAFSHESRIAGEWDTGNWLVGVFYAHEELEFNTSVTTGGLSSVVGPVGLTQQEEFYARRFLGTTSFNAFNPAAFPTAQYVAFQGTDDKHNQETDSFAIFTNESFKLGDVLEATMGLRYTHEEKEMASSYDNQTANLACLNLRNNIAAVAGAIALLPANPGESNAARTARFVGTVCSTGGDPIYDGVNNFQTSSENELTGTGKLSARLDDDLMVYASYARGYKAGGFNLDRERTGSINLPPAAPTGPRLDLNTRFAQEIVDAYELGAKTTWFDGALLFNAAYFHQIYENFQLNTFTGTQFIVTPIPEVVSRGIDTDFFIFGPIEGLSFQGGVVYAETQYGVFNAALAGVPARLPTQRVSFAPLYSGTLAATYETPLWDSMMIRFNVAGKYTSDYNSGSDLNQFKAQPAYTVVNGRIALGPDDESWALEFWGQNITDEDIIQVGFDAPAQTDIVNAFLAQPETYGLTLRASY